jgi:hypothetical protein
LRRRRCLQQQLRCGARRCVLLPRAPLGLRLLKLLRLRLLDGGSQHCCPLWQRWRRLGQRRLQGGQGLHAPAQ